MYVNVVGGLRVDEPAADLGMALAMLSSFKDSPIPEGVIAIGELGLAGEVRGVAQLDRLREAVQLGFTRAIVPRSPGTPNPAVAGLEVLGVRTLREAALVVGAASSAAAHSVDED